MLHEKQFREHQIKSFITLSRLWLLGFGWIREKRKARVENLFVENDEWGSKKLLKMIFTDVKADVKQQEVNELVAVSCMFL